MNLKELGTNLGLDESEFIELVELFLTTAQNDLQKLQDGFRSGDSKSVTEAAHSLKGSSGNLGFIELSLLSKKAEEKGNGNEFSDFGELIDAMRRQIEKIEACLTQSI